MAVKTSGESLPRMDKAIRSAVKDRVVTKKEAGNIADAAGRDITRSRQPTRDAKLANRQAEVLATQSNVKFKGTTGEELVYNTQFAVGNARAERLGHAAERTIKQQFTRDDGANLTLMGSPYDAVDPSTIKWGDADGGSMQIGFDRNKLPAKYLMKPELLEGAMTKLSQKLAQYGYDGKTQKAFHQHWIPYVTPGHA